MQKFSASSATRHMNCSASGDLEKAIPHWIEPEKDPDADNAANRGTMMHEIMANAEELSAKDMLMLADAMAYIAAVRQQRRFKKLIEVTANAKWLVSSPPTTADLVLYTNDELHVLDLKTGTIPVSAVENEQLMYYAITYGGLAPKAKGAYLHIVQPWADNMEMWFADAARLGQFMTDALDAEQKILKGQLDFSPGDHCMFCPANPHGRGARGKPFCPAMMQLLYPRPEPDYDEMLAME